jgi:hypothetical protein
VLDTLPSDFVGVFTRFSTQIRNHHSDNPSLSCALIWSGRLRVELERDSAVGVPQELTAERVLINADTGVHLDLLNSRFGYVAVSRASHQETIFTNDASKMGHQLETQVTKTSAMEIAQTIPAGHGRGLM